MGNFKKIKSNIDQVEKIIANLEGELKLSPDNFPLNIELSSFKSQLDDLCQALYRENIKRGKEIIELRLIGESANYGSIPLRFVGGITNNFSSFMFNTSSFLKFGEKIEKKKEKIIEETIDLRFEGIGRGSTIFYLSGKTSPDVFGNSIIQKALENIFNLFHSDNHDVLAENISKVGGAKSIKYISNFLSELTNDELEIDIKWKSPDERKIIWEGKKEKIVGLYNSLNQIDISQPEEVEFFGEIVMISSKGRFEVQTDNDYISGQFPDSLLGEMKEFHIGERCKGIVYKKTISNTASGKEKVEYMLKSIE
ncbi:MAG: hypothetical protein ACTFAL_01210 [Candidatus Electronema sp. V4]|uniref:hypothetical protein n=1 Tax=Candidatus Electronema sp. V4 TaxID=3454756 RepID=UPI00405586FA